MIKQGLLENQVKQSYLAIGSNLGNKLENIEKAKFEIIRNGIDVIKCSSNFESQSWPNPFYPKYINIILEVITNLAPLDLLKVCNSIEKKLGRKRLKKNAPRTCDIDIIDYKQKIISLKNNYLTLPHPKMTQRSFVLLPLFEINKSWKHPKSKKNITNLVKSLPIKDLRSIKQI
ncbi:2-amino-4-hydroxy-6-hydroxymethyldihydropteridine diphosphokinase [Candidatus Pelagibacter sp.]|nr:2-amino-4-hydroxy-6-hydroxymethyldihydropteridine diphosphokinase [Candidatus Pelagibacter sp.]